MVMTTMTMMNNNNVDDDGENGKNKKKKKKMKMVATFMFASVCIYVRGNCNEKRTNKQRVLNETLYKSLNKTSGNFYYYYCRLSL